ncbi:hypothetical protein BSKO_00623 [Bryopsis sp. KO-2023]|nr:hypothetical protein BSKO_00623 [Bryopsis sp. KO-2023]
MAAVEGSIDRALERISLNEVPLELDALKQAAKQEKLLAEDPHRQVPVAPYQAVPFSGSAIQYEAKPIPLEEPDQTMSKKERIQKIDQIIFNFEAKLAERSKFHMGYPYNLDFDFGALKGLTDYSINNLGDPFIESNYGVHSREFEVGVLEWFAKLWEIEVKDFWGYITNCGTEGNLHGILVGRENLPDGVLYASAESHYSVFKAGRMYRLETEKIPTLETGEISYDALEERLRHNSDKPAILNVNIGTTVKGAVDDLDRILDILARVGYTEDRFYIHCDGALFGLMIPFVKKSPMVTFKKPIGSVSVSGHKFVGAPVPCGVVITRLRYVEALSSDIEYINSRDATIMGSRNGHASVFLWYTLAKKGYSGMRKDVEKCLRNAHLLKTLLSQAGVKCMLNDLSCTVVFERPQEEAFVRKWQLACEKDIAHVVVMPNITIEKLEQFVLALIESRAKMAKLSTQKMILQAKSDEEEEE